MKRSDYDVMVFVHDDDVTPVVTSFWVVGEPSKETQKCVTAGYMHWTNTFGWDDANCDNIRDFLCEFAP
jgi:hypothetical protein